MSVIPFGTTSRSSPASPAHGETEPTRCYDTPDGGTGIPCRIVAGYEETGYDRDFTVNPKDSLGTGHNRKYGTSLVSRAGDVYEGCRNQDGNWICDDKTRKQVSRDHYQSKGHVARTFWRWKEYIKSQASCAGAISGLRVGGSRKGLLCFLDECNYGPM